MSVLALAFDNPAALWALALALPLTVLFLLKRKRRDVPVSSTMLWQRALKETIARAPFRKPSEWLSLLLLLLALCALALGAAGMRLGRGGTGGRALILVIDASASMTARTDSGTRMELAIARARDALNGLREGDSATLIVAGATPRILAHATGDAPALLSLLDDVRAQAQGCNLQGAMALAVAEARRSAPAEIVLLSDFAHDPGLWNEIQAGEARLTLVTCGGPVRNAGIVHAAASADEFGAGLLVRVAGVDRRTLSLHADGALLDAREIEPVPGREAQAVFALPALENVASLRLTLRLEPGDEFALDDTVHVAISRSRPPRLLHVGDANPFIERLAEAIPGLGLVHVRAAEYAAWREAEAEAFDLALLTAPVEPPPRASREFWFGCAPPGLGVVDAGEIERPELVDWDRTNALLRGVGMENVIALGARRLELPPGARELARLRGGPLLAQLTAPGRDVFVWAAAIEDSNLVLRPAFPVLIRNALGSALGRISARAARCADALAFAMPPGTEGVHTFEVSLPGGQTRRGEADATRELLLRGPFEPGFARGEVPAMEEATQEYGLSLLDARETTLGPAPPDVNGLSGASAEVVSAQTWATERPIWQWCVALAALVLLAEFAIPMITTPARRKEKSRK